MSLIEQSKPTAATAGRPQPLRLTLEEYERIAESGGFNPIHGYRIELIRGYLRVGMKPLYLTLEQYEGMVDAGAFDALSSHVELIRGELCAMSPQGGPHHHILLYLSYWSFDNTDRNICQVSGQCPIRIPFLATEPEPDLTWHKPIDRTQPHPEPQDVFLLIEIAVSSVDFDLDEKALIYAQAGIRDYWVVDVPDQLVHVFRQPTASGYLEHQEVPVGREVHPLSFPDVVLHTAELFAD
jgi:Uma2 family endonuclease